MNIVKSIAKTLIGVFLLSFMLVSCIYQNLNSDLDNSGMKGTLKGKISIGPICPVETNPPLPECLPTEETYRIYAVAVWSKDEKSKIAVIKPNLDGTYIIEIPANEYIINFDSKYRIAIGGSNMPVSVSIEPNHTTEININIDTGIR